MLGLIVGCGGSPTGPKRTYADVVGKVSYKGAPVTMGSVMFQPATGPFVEGKINPDGTYTLKGEIGMNSVTIVSRDPIDPAAPVVPGTTPVSKSHIPERYGTRQSGLTFEVKAGKNTADFNLPD